jgi:hypothetical protein
VRYALHMSRKSRRQVLLGYELEILLLEPHDLDEILECIVQIGGQLGKMKENRSK